MSRRDLLAAAICAAIAGGAILFIWWYPKWSLECAGRILAPYMSAPDASASR